MKVTRREFVGGAVAALSIADAAPQGAPDGGWFDRPMRWAQLTLVEDDPGKYDRNFWLDYFKRTHSDAACLSAGGCVALLPDENSAALQEPMAERRGRSVRRTGCGMPEAGDERDRADRSARGPSGRLRRASGLDRRRCGKGEKRRHPVMPELWTTCALGPYNFEFMTEVTKEIVSLYKVDGVFSNRWAGSGMCYCEHCRENFTAICEIGFAAHGESARSGAARVHRMASAAAIRTVAAVGRGDSQDQSGGLLHPQHRRRRAGRSGHEDDRRAGADSVRRPPGAQRAGADVG